MPLSQKIWVVASVLLAIAVFIGLRDWWRTKHIIAQGIYLRIEISGFGFPTKIYLRDQDPIVLPRGVVIPGLPGKVNPGTCIEVIKWWKWYEFREIPKPS